MCYMPHRHTATSEVYASAMSDTFMERDRNKDIVCGWVLVQCRHTFEIRERQHSEIELNNKKIMKKNTIFPTLYLLIF